MVLWHFPGKVCLYSRLGLQARLYGSWVRAGDRVVLLKVRPRAGEVRFISQRLEYSTSLDISFHFACSGLIGSSSCAPVPYISNHIRNASCFRFAAWGTRTPLVANFNYDTVVSILVLVYIVSRVRSIPSPTILVFIQRGLTDRRHE
jgi:hypothetical protein